MFAPSAARNIGAFLSALVLLAAASSAVAQAGASAGTTLTATATVLTRCTVEAGTPAGLSCSQPVAAQRETSAVETLIIDGVPRRVVISTINF
jgi:hypothetical protein